MGHFFSGSHRMVRKTGVALNINWSCQNLRKYEKFSILSIFFIQHVVLKLVVKVTKQKKSVCWVQSYVSMKRFILVLDCNCACLLGWVVLLLMNNRYVFLVLTCFWTCLVQCTVQSLGKFKMTDSKRSNKWKIIC